MNYMYHNFMIVFFFLFYCKAAQCKNQFGVALSCLVPEGSTQVPTVLGKCLQYIEEHGQFRSTPA